MMSLKNAHIFDALLQAYPCSRIYQPSGLISVNLDDRSGTDVYSLFCTIQLRALRADSSTFQLVICNLPTNDGVEKIVDELEGVWKECGSDRVLTLNLSWGQLSMVMQLAKAIRKVVGRGARYLDSNWKWMAPRTAASLEHFVRTAKAARRNSR